MDHTRTKIVREDPSMMSPVLGRNKNTQHGPSKRIKQFICITIQCY